MLVLVIKRLKQIYFVNPLIIISFSILILLTHFTTKNPLFKARDCISKDCSSPATFQRKLQSLKTWFCKRGYPHKIVDSQIKRVSEKSLDELFEGLDEKETGVPLVVTNHSRFHNLSAILRKIF